MNADGLSDVDCVETALVGALVADPSPPEKALHLLSAESRMISSRTMTKISHHFPLPLALVDFGALLSESLGGFLS